MANDRLKDESKLDGYLKSLFWYGINSADREVSMKQGIHPEYKQAQIICACGYSTETRSTVGNIHVDICSNCHPFFTGKQKFIDAAGRVEKFRKRYALKSES
jgi:large subunit ribosomal protein L31